MALAGRLPADWVELVVMEATSGYSTATGVLELTLHPHAPLTARFIPATARVDPGMRRGAVSVPHGYSDANVNRLTSHLQADPLTGMARYSGIPVSVHPAAPR